MFTPEINIPTDKSSSIYIGIKLNLSLGGSISTKIEKIETNIVPNK
jgi:uncharacterized alkaline shock family protein YloU